MSSIVRNNLLNIRAWYNRQVNKPWEENGLIKISIKAETLDRGLDPSAYFTLDSPEGAAMVGQPLPNNAVAVLKIFDFYGKYIQPTDAISMAIPAAPENNIHFFARSMQRPVLLFSIEKSIIEEAPKKIWNVGAATTELLEVYSQDYPISKFDKRIAALSGMFKAFQAQSKYFDGSTKPSINFLQDYNKLVAASKKIRAFIEFNGYEYRAKEADKIRITFDASHRITNIILVQKGLDIYLLKGKTYFLKDSSGLKDQRINRLLQQLNKIYCLKNRREVPPWSEFLKEFLPSVEIDFFGRAHSDTEANKQGKGKPFESADDLDALGRANQDINTQLRMLQETMEKDPRRKKMEKKLQDVAKKMHEAEEKVEMVREFLTKWGIMNLINAALECLAIKSGWTSRSLPPIPGINPYDIMPKPIILKIPRVDVALPVVNIAKAITDEIKKGLLEAAYDALMAVSQTLADIIVELCRGQPEAEPEEGIPINSLVDLYPQPTEINKPGQDDDGTGGGTRACLESCYEEIGITPDVGDSFLLKVAQNVTARETCDLLNDAASDAVTEVVRNLLVTDPEFGEGSPSLRTILSDPEIIVEFFACLGRCVSDDYCESVYAEPPINVDNVDPCTIEDMLAAAIDPTIFDALLEAYDNAEDLMEGALPDLGCGAGIVPAFANMPALNHSITSMLTNIFEIPKTTFINDITLLKDILLVPDPGCSSENAALFEKLREAGALPNPGPPRNDDGKKQNPDKGGALLESLFPHQLMADPAVAGVVDIIRGATAPTASMCAGVDITYKVAPDYQRRLALLDRSIRSPWLDAGSGKSSEGDPDYNNMFFSILMINHKDIRTSTKVFFSPGEVLPAGSAPEPHGWTGIVSAPWDPSTEGTANKFKCESSERFSAGCAGREEAVSLFETTVFDHYISSLGLEPISGEPTDKAPLRQACKRSLYFPAYLSLFNSMAYNVKSSKLFKVSELRKLSLIPGKCPNGAVFGNDLFDVDKIIQEAFDEFEENSCSDKTCAVGPVEDALIYAILNAYIQVLLLEQLLKNIFLLDAYGLGDFLKDSFVSDNIIEEIYESIGTSTIVPPANPGEEGMEHVVRNMEREMLKALMNASIIFVDKLRIRTEGPSGEDPGQYLPQQLYDPSHPDSDPETGLVDLPPQLIPSSVMDSIAMADVSADQKYGKYALEYMIRKRLDKMAVIIGNAFGKPTGTSGTSFFLFGLPDADVLDFSKLAPASAPLKPELVHASNRHDIFTWKLQSPPPPPELRSFHVTDAEVVDVAYEYGTSVQYPGLMSDTISEDEATFAAANGIFVRENYIKVDVNLGNLADMEHATATAEGGVQAAMETQTNSYYSGFIRDWMNDLLPTPMDNTGAGEYAYEPGWNEMVVSIDRFNTFLNQVKAEDTRAPTTLDNIEVIYIVRTKEPENAWKQRKRYDCGSTGLPWEPINIGLGSKTPSDKADSRSSYYHAVRGPLRKRNYDAIRFFLNEVRSYTNDSPTVNVAHEGELYEGLSYPQREVKTHTLPSEQNLWRDGQPRPAYPWEEERDGLDPWDPATFDTNGRRWDYFRDEIKGFKDYENLYGRIQVGWGVGVTAKAFVPSWTSNSDSDFKGRIIYRPRKGDLYPSDYNQAMWTGYPTNVIRGFDKRWHGAADPTHAFLPGTEFAIPPGDSNGDGYMDWAQNFSPNARFSGPFWTYPEDINDTEAWRWYTGEGGSHGDGIDYASAEPSPGNPGPRGEVAGTFLPDSMVRIKLQVGYAANLIPPPRRLGWESIVSRGSAGHVGGFTCEWSGKHQQQLNCQDLASGGGPGGHNGPDVCPAYLGMANAHFEVVDMYLSDSDVQAQILNKTWSEFRALMGDPAVVDTPAQSLYPGSGGTTGNKAPGATPGQALYTPDGDEEEGMSSPMGVPAHEEIPAERLRVMMRDLAVEFFSGQDSDFPNIMMPRSTGYLTGERAFDEAISRVLKNIRVGTRIAYYSPEMDTSHPVMKGLIGATPYWSTSIAEPVYTSDEHMHEHAGGGDWTIHANSSDHGDGAHDPGGGYVPHSHPAYTALGPSIPGGGATYASGKGADPNAPALPGGSSHGPTGFQADTAGGAAQSYVTARPDAGPDPNPAIQRYHKNKSNWLIEGAGNKRIWNVDTGIFAEEMLALTVSSLEFSSRTRDMQRLGGAKISKYEDTRKYDVVRPFLNELGTTGFRSLLSNNIIGQEGYANLFNKAYDADALLQFLFMIGLRSSNMLSDDFTTMFNDTKQSLRVILRAALAGDDYAYKDPESSTSSDAAAAAALDLLGAGLMPFSEMGQSFVLKMLIETPKRILKGLAEMIDPHVVVGKIIKDVSGQVIDQAEQYFKLTQTAAGMGAGFAAAAGEEVPKPVGAMLEGTLVEHMQKKINEDFSGLPRPLRPCVTPEGLNLVGTLPYLFALPPGPLGIIYILLGLQGRCGEGDSMDPTVRDAIDWCQDAVAPFPPQLSAPDFDPGMWATSTYNCDDDDRLGKTKPDPGDQDSPCKDDSADGNGGAGGADCT